MKKLIALTCLGLLIVTSVPAVAGVQQEKMRMCNKEAKEKALTGVERKAFMKSCLSKEGGVVTADSKAETTPAEKADKRAARHEKRKMCKQEAKDKTLKGEDHKAFMKACLSKKVDAASVENKEDAAHAEKKSDRQEKRDMCSTKANDKDLKGPERRKFLRECLNG